MTQDPPPAPVPHWIDGDGWFGCTKQHEYNGIYTRLVAGDRQGAARRIADARTMERLTNFQPGEEVLLIGEMDGLVLLRRPRAEQEFWTRKEAISPVKPQVINMQANSGAPVAAEASPGLTMPDLTTEPTPSFGMSPVAATPMAEANQDNAQSAPTTPAEPNPTTDPFQEWLYDNPKPEPTYYTWESVDGKHSTIAELLSLSNNEVRIRKRDGAEVTVRLDQLSESTRTMLDNTAIPGLATYKRQLRSWERAAEQIRTSAGQETSVLPNTNLANPR